MVLLFPRATHSTRQLCTPADASSTRMASSATARLACSSFQLMRRLEHLHQSRQSHFMNMGSGRWSLPWTHQVNSFSSYHLTWVVLFRSSIQFRSTAPRVHSVLSCLRRWMQEDSA